MRTLCFVVLFALGAPALAQEARAPSQPAANADEVVVEGRKPENVYAEIERLEISVYDRFNALNSNDEFDIHCFKQAPTGSNIAPLVPRRIRFPNRVRNRLGRFSTSRCACTELGRSTACVRW